ncbi:MAG: Stk1 family PASTA domain-containing Ser/Thr kinase [Bacillota bacterium]
MIGQILGNRYELIEKIGGGGMALVYKAKCKLLNRFVAVKVLRPEFTNDEEFVKRFRIEAQAAASLSHPNIVSIYDVGHEGDIHYIVMEYVNGATLKQYIEQQGALDWKEAVNIAIQICLAIEHAHKNHIVHRDIKPHNILFTKEGVAKVTDFGIARAVSSSTITMAGSTIGSVHYFSPEQARGGFTDEKSDLYSLGIVLYELLTGKLPFNGESPVAVAIKHIQDEPEEPVSIKNDIPKGVNSIVMGAIQKDQSKRYQTATELLEHLYTVLREPNTDFSVSENMEDSPTVRIPSIGSKGIVLDKDPSKKTGDESMRKKKDKMTTILALATSIIIIAVIGFMASRIVYPMLINKPVDFIVDDYTGKNFYEVKGMLSQFQIEAKDIRKYDDEVPKDMIISQNRAKGEKLKPGAEGYNTIEFYVSEGPLLVKVPDLRRIDSRLAESKIKALGLIPEIIEEYSETVTKGLVIRTEPDINEQIKPNTTVKIFVSIGPEIKTTIVPDLVGKKRSQALSMISNANLAVGKIYPEDMTYAVDKIIRQEPEAGKEVNEDTPVNIYFENSSPEEKLANEVINLDESIEYGEYIRVLVNITRSDTNQVQELYREVRKKSEFPITISIPVPNGGSTLVRVYLNSRLHSEFTETF